MTGSAFSRTSPAARSRFYSRNGADFTRRFRGLVPFLKGLPDCVLDGEVIACGKDGLPDFVALMSQRPEHPLCFWAFDLLAVGEKLLIDEPLECRRKKLREIIETAAERSLQFSPDFDDATALMQIAEFAGLEGIVSKRKGSPYRAGPSRLWIKTKTRAWRQANLDRWKLFEK